MSVDCSVSAIAEEEYENTEAGSVERTVSGYNPYKAAEYANKWVNPTAYNSDDDTDYYNGKLCSSTGTVLATDDSSGDLNNFSISYNLVKDRTYYIYVSSLHYAQGFYGLKVSN